MAKIEDYINNVRALVREANKSAANDMGDADFTPFMEAKHLIRYIVQ